VKKIHAYVILAVILGFVFTFTPLLAAAGPSLSFFGKDPSKPDFRISLSGQSLSIERDSPFKGMEIFAVSLTIALAGYLMVKKRVRSPRRTSVWPIPY
jgi:hypothetical protein